MRTIQTAPCESLVNLFIVLLYIFLNKLLASANTFYNRSYRVAFNYNCLSNSPVGSRSYGRIILAVPISRVMWKVVTGLGQVFNTEKHSFIVHV